MKLQILLVLTLVFFGQCLKTKRYQSVPFAIGTSIKFTGQSISPLWIEYFYKCLNAASPSASNPNVTSNYYPINFTVYIVEISGSNGIQVPLFV